MVWPWVLNVQINEQPMVIHHNYVFHGEHLFPPIKLATMGQIVPRLMNFDEGPINKSNVTLELWKLCCQNPSTLNNGPMNFIDNGKIHAKCNKYAIIIYCTLTPIPLDNIVFSHISCFMNKMKLNKCNFKANLDNRPIMWCGSPMDLPWLIMVGTISCANSSNFPKIKLVSNI